MSIFTFTQNVGYFEYSAPIPDYSWIGYHEYILTASMAGYKDVSTEVSVIIIDGCKNSVVNGDGGLVIPSIFSNPDGTMTQNWSFNGPTDSTSVTYGNGYDVCGPLTYTLTNQQGETPDLSFFSTNYVLNTDTMDTFDYSL